MKKTILFCFSLLLFSCADKPVQKPDILLDQQVMENILFDIVLLQAQNTIKPGEKKDINSAEYIYTKYNIDSTTYIQNHKYYASDVTNFKKMYNHINDRIKDLKTTLDSVKIENKKELKQKPIFELQPKK